MLIEWITMIKMGLPIDKTMEKQNFGSDQIPRRNKFFYFYWVKRPEDIKFSGKVEF